MASRHTRRAASTSSSRARRRARPGPGGRPAVRAGLGPGRPDDAASPPTLESFDRRSRSVREALRTALDDRRSKPQRDAQLRPKSCCARGSSATSKPTRRSGVATCLGRSILDDEPMTSAASPSAARRRCRSSSPPGLRPSCARTGPTARSTRAYFAYGLASSFEAYADTRRNRTRAGRRGGGRRCHRGPDSPQLRWYLDGSPRRCRATPPKAGPTHPKVAATVERVRQALGRWREDPGLLLLRRDRPGAACAHLPRAPSRGRSHRSAGALGDRPRRRAAVLEELDGSAERLLRADTRGYEALPVPGRGRSPRASTPSCRRGRRRRDPVHAHAVVPRALRRPLAADLRRRPPRRPRAPDLSGTTLADRVRASPMLSARGRGRARGDLLDALDRHPDRRHRRDGRRLRPVGALESTARCCCPTCGSRTAASPGDDAPAADARVQHALLPRGARRQLGHGRGRRPPPRLPPRDPPRPRLEPEHARAAHRAGRPHRLEGASERGSRS